ncbi:N-acyl amino acid synthase FeeM domain-containing protein [Aquabacter sediminis]|uniref:N-acyl amino acid synthase FeeM domain-containing protein n=1 Tax=Aquabacter sediminis TaxID=3029197 RepID=UPI003CCFE126
MNTHAPPVPTQDSRLSQRVIETFNLASFARSRTEAEICAISRFRHECYLREDAIRPLQDGRMEYQYDYMENTFNISIFIEDEIACAIRIHVLTAHSPYSPSAQAFPDIVGPLLQQGLTLIDPTRFVVCARAARRYPELAYVTLKIPFAASDYFNADVALASVRQEHMGFYAKYLRYTARSEFRKYLQLTKPLALMTSNFREEAPCVLRRYPFFRRHNERLNILFSQ